MAGSRNLKTFTYDARGYDGLDENLAATIDSDVAAFLTTESAAHYDGTAVAISDQYVVVSVLWTDTPDV